MSDAQERFLRDAARRLPLERVVELHLFPAMRQGGVETGFAVIAAQRPATDEAPAPEAAVADGGADRSPEEDPLADALLSDASPPDAARDDEAPPARQPVRDERLVVFSARYRLALKGPDRGRWEVDVVEEADAPLVTVDAVVRGVQRRVGEGAEPERLTAAQLQSLLAEPARAAGSAPTAMPRG